MNSRFLPIPWLTRPALARRTRHIAAVLTRHGWGWLLLQVESGRAVSRGRIPGVERPEISYQKQAEHLRLAMSELGATFIKLGQALSSRPDILPAEYINELGKLQDEVPPLPFDKIEGVIKEELGCEVLEAYAEFDPVPIASASIGQVYAAKTKNDRQVVVKVRRPGVTKTIEQDLEIIANMAEWLSLHSSIGQLYDLPSLVGEFSFRLRNELDYVREGRNANIFHKNFSDDPSVHIPYVYWDLTTQKVITLERVSGIKISDVETIRKAGINLKMVAENSGRFTLRQLFEFGFFHADPHPGNFFVQPDGSLAVVDYGMVGRLSNQMRSILLRMVMAMANGDSESLVDELMDIGVTRRLVNRRGLILELNHIFESYVGGNAQFLTATQVLNEILGMAFRYGMQFPGELTMLVRLTTINEGISQALYPEFRMLDFATPYVLKFWRKERSPEKIIPELASTALDGLELSLSLPRRAARLLKQMERGQLEFNINYEGLRQFASQMEKMTNRLAMAILLAAVIVALGIVLVIYHPVTWQTFGQYLFFFAFLSSLAVGAWLLWSIWRSGKS
ncbi:MAG TPA: AarF/ABC1/UbiB kinase family protein [Anaerolineaceae bacterium]|nr:AarF/ABC1/UbiB kinase family protein [Anaerolineaceae bacterium]